MREMKEKVLERCEQLAPELVDFLSQYLRFRSVNPDLARERNVITEIEECQEWLKQQLTQWKIFDEVKLLRVKPGAANIVATLPGKSQGLRLMFNGHSDVVPVSPEEESAWEPDAGPWDGKTKNGWIYGRGAADMKAGNVAALFALKAVAQTARDSLVHGVVFSLVSTEESGDRRAGVDYILDQGYKAPLCILPEPTNLAIANQILGEFYFRLRVLGKSTHICRRHLCIHPSYYGVELPGVNAIDKMRKILNALEVLEHEWGLYQRSKYTPPGSMTLNISQIKGGSNFSSLAESCEVIGSVLFNPELRSKDVVEELRGVIDGVARMDYWLRKHSPILEIPYMLDVKEPVRVPEESEIVQCLRRNFRYVMQRDPELVTSVGTSDGNYLFTRDVVPVQLGLEEEGVHGTNERASISNVLSLTKIFALTILDICGKEG